MTMQARLLDLPMSGVYPIAVDEANALLVKWGHKLGPVNRPFRQEAYSLECDGRVVAVATSGSIVNGPVAGYSVQEVVELTRLAACEPWANRVMLRLWREVCAPAWGGGWKVRAAVSYSHNALHRGDLYRFDGWEKVTDKAGSTGTGGSVWGRRQYSTPARQGRKTLWVWRYAADDQVGDIEGGRDG